MNKTIRTQRERSKNKHRLSLEPTFDASRFCLIEENGYSGYIITKDIDITRPSEIRTVLEHAHRTLLMVSNRHANIFTLIEPVYSIAQILGKIPKNRYDFLLILNTSDLYSQANYAIGRGATLLYDETGKPDSRYKPLIPSASFEKTDGFGYCRYTGNLPDEVIFEYVAHCFQDKIELLSEMIRRIATTIPGCYDFDSGDWSTLSQYAKIILFPYLTETERDLYCQFENAITQTSCVPWYFRVEGRIADYVLSTTWTNTEVYHAMETLSEKTRALCAIWNECAKKADTIKGNTIKEKIANIRHDCGADYAVDAFFNGVPIQHLVEETMPKNNW